MHKRVTFYFFLFTFFSLFNLSFSKDRVKIDSLLTQVHLAKQDTEKVNLLNNLAQRFAESSDGGGPGSYYIDSIMYYATKANELATKSNFKRGEAISLFKLATACYYKELFKEAIDYILPAIRKFKDLNDQDNVALGLNNLGYLYGQLGNQEKALDSYFKALPVFEKLQENFETAHCLNNIGLIYIDQKNYEKAKDFFDEALKYSELSGDKRTKAMSLNNLGIVYKKQEDYEKALDNYLKSLELYETMGNKKEQAVAIGNIGKLYFSKGDTTKAMEYYEKALNIFQEINSQSGISLNWGRIAEVFERESKYDDALTYYNKALLLNEKMFGFYYELNTSYLIEMANSYSKKHALLKALQLNQQAIISVDSTFRDTSVYSIPGSINKFSSNYFPEALLQKGKLFHDYYSNYTHNPRDLKMSFDTYLLTSALIDKIRTNYKTESAKLEEGKTAKATYEDAIAVSNELYAVTKDKRYQFYTLEFAEKSKSMVMLELANETKARRFAGIPDSLLAKQHDMKLDLTFYETQLEKSKSKKEKKDSIRARDYEDRLFVLKEKNEELMTSIEKEYPRYYDLKYQTKIASIKDIQKSLDNKTAMLEYFVGDSNLYIYTITSTDFAIYSCKKDSLLKSKVNDYCGAIKKAETEKYLVSSKELYRELMQPVEAGISGKEKLIIIPDDILYYMPFEALVKNTAVQDKTDFSKLNYLVKEHSVVYHYSATLYLKSVVNKPNAPVAGNNLIGFAPVFKNETGNGLITAKIEALDTRNNQEPILRSITLDGKKFNELPYSEEEVRSIVNGFNTSNHPSVAYIESSATEENFKQNAPNYTYIHVATHGFVNEENPDLSGLIFSQPKDSTSKEDGILYAGELYNLDLKNTDLVVLSSCESGIGKLVKGEGLLALPRGFLYAGTPNIIYSLWKIDDKHTSELMQGFYKNMLSNKSYENSLRAAKLAMIINPQTAFPKNWSGFVLVGK